MPVIGYPAVSQAEFLLGMGLAPRTNALVEALYKQGVRTVSKYYVISAVAVLSGCLWYMLYLLTMVGK